MSINILFVCAGNMFRSPLAEGLLKYYGQKEGISDFIHVDSAGTRTPKEGRPPDHRAIKKAEEHGVLLEGLSRKFRLKDFQRFDGIYAMDLAVYSSLQQQADPGEAEKIKLITDFEDTDYAGKGIPDPYHGGKIGHIYKRVNLICLNIARELKHKLETQQG